MTIIELFAALRNQAVQTRQRLDAISSDPTWMNTHNDNMIGLLEQMEAEIERVSTEPDPVPVTGVDISGLLGGMTMIQLTATMEAYGSMLVAWAATKSVADLTLEDVQSIGPHIARLSCEFGTIMATDLATHTEAQDGSPAN